MAFWGVLALILLVVYHAPVVLSARGALEAKMGAWAAVRMRFGFFPALPERVVFLSRFPADPNMPRMDWRAARGAFPVLWRPAHLEMALAIGAGDAAATAILCGGAHALGHLSPRAHLRVRPEFAGEMHLRLEGMFRVKTGHIVLAWIAYWREKRREKNG